MTHIAHGWVCSLRTMRQKIVAVYGSSRALPGDGVYEMGVELGRRLAEAGFAVTNGGYSGLMEAVSQGATAAGGRVIGVTAPSLFPDRPGGNRFLTVEVPATTLLERISIMSRLADAYVIMPGSIGTLTELAVAWNDAYLAAGRGAQAVPIVAIESAWGELVDCLTRRLATTPGLVAMVDDPAQAVETLTDRLGGC